MRAASSAIRRPASVSVPVLMAPSARGLRPCRSPHLRYAGRATDRRCRALAALAPDLLRRLHDQSQLGDLLLARERVAVDGRGEAALGREAELVDVDVPRRL